MKSFASSGSLKCSTSVSQVSNRSPSFRFWYAVVSKSFAAAEKTGSSVINDSLSFKASSNAGSTKWRSWNTFSRAFFLYPHCLKCSLSAKWPHCKQGLDVCFYPNYNHWYQNLWVACIQNSMLETVTCLAGHQSLFSLNFLSSFLIFVTAGLQIIFQTLLDMMSGKNKIPSDIYKNMSDIKFINVFKSSK